MEPAWIYDVQAGFHVKEDNVSVSQTYEMREALRPLPNPRSYPILMCVPYIAWLSTRSALYYA